MALTRPKYSQIYDSDAKNSARVATTASVTLTGGAPNTVDDISLALKDRVLVKSQANTAQNGIYYVTVLGTGANGTWTRSLDADSNVKLTSGTTLSIEEGTINAGKAFRMTSTGTIILGQSAITWTDVSGGGGSAGGNNGQIQYNDTNAFGGAGYLWYNEITGTVTANSGVASTNTTTGTFIVTGGVGISGALNVGSTLNVGANVSVTGNVLPSANVTYNLGSPDQRWKDLFLAGNTINLNGATISAVNGAITFQNSLGGSFSVTGSAGGQSTGTFGNLIANSGVASTTTSTGALTVTGGAGISGALNVGGTSSHTGIATFASTLTGSGNIVAASGTASTNTTSGALVVVGGIGASGAVYIGGTSSHTGAATFASTITASGNIVAASGTASTGTTSGALVVAGGAGVSGAVYIGGLINVAGDATVTGNLTVNGTTTNINTTNLVVEDKNIIVADVASPTNTTADGAGITVKGSTDKTFNWVSLTGAWTSSEDLDLLTGKQYEINGTAVLTATTLGSGVVNSSLTSLGTIAALVATNSSATTAVATNFSSGNIVATNSTSGTWSTANVSLYESVTATTTNATFYPILADKTAGNTGGFSAATLTHNPSTGNLTAVGHVGNHWGPVAATTANVSSTLSVTGTSTFTGATNHAAGITASTVSAGTIGNAGATLTGTLNTAAQTNITSVGTLTSLTTSGNLSVPAASLITGGNIRLGDWPGNTNYTSVQQAGMSGSEYGLLMGKTDKNTYISSWTGGAVNIRGGANSTTCQITVSGSAITITGALTPAANLTYDLGSTTAWWNNVYGVSVQAKYADLAERYEADAEYEPGTVVIFGGDKEITVSTRSHDTRVAGVVSTDPAYLMNAANPGLPVALQGRVPCRVQGPVTKGDVVVTSDTPGVAQRIDNSRFLPGCVVGKALESINTDSIETIEVIVGRF
jgi:hypothetical protein